MNTPNPQAPAYGSPEAAAAQAAKVDPTTPGDKEKPTALGSAANTATIGTGASVVVVWIIDTFVTVHGQPITLNVEQAVAVGGFGAALFGYVAQVAHAVLQILIDKLNKLGS